MWPAVKLILHSVYGEPDAGAVHVQFGRLLDYVKEKLPAATEHLGQAREDILAFNDFSTGRVEPDLVRQPQRG